MSRYTLVIEGECPPLAPNMKVYIDSAGENHFSGRVMEFSVYDLMEKTEMLEKQVRSLGGYIE